MNNSLQQLDTAVIGGGITGLYACLLLHRKKGPNHAMALFEMSDRFGGRIETIDMDGFLAEYGPMRFEKRGQPLLMHLIHELGLETCYFHPYTPATDPESLFNLKEDDAHPVQKTSGNCLYNTLELLCLGILRILRRSGGDLYNPRDPRHWSWWEGLDEEFYRQVRKTMTFQGEPLFKTGFWNILCEVLGYKAVKKIIDYGTFYHVIHYNPSAAEWIIFWLRGLHPKDELVGIKQGTESLIKALVNKLSSLQPKPVPLYLNHQLVALKQEEGERIRLTLQSRQGKKVEVLARHVILAVPQRPLNKLSVFLPDHINRLINNVILVPLLKCFFVTKAPWWDSHTKPQTRSSSTPTRELHYYYREEDGEKRGMVMLYGDKPFMSYWKPFVKKEIHSSAELNQDERLIKQYLKYLSAVPGIDEKAQSEAITCFGIHDWGREPYEAGCHIWKPGVKVDEAMDTLKSFSLAGSPAAYPTIHICGEAYSDFQGFIEGGLRSALEVIKHIE